MHERRVEPDIFIPIHGLAPGWILQFINPEKFLDGVNYHVHGSCVGATDYHTCIPMLPGNCPFSCHPLMGNPPWNYKKGNIVNLISDWMLAMVCTYMFVCMYVIVVDIGFMSRVSCTYACAIFPPMSDRMFAVQQN